MYHRNLREQARKFAEHGLRGWVTPTGGFFECDETPAVRMLGLELGGHERAALQWLEANRPDLLALLEQERVEGGYECWEDTDGKGVITKFMLRHGFNRVADDDGLGEGCG